MVESVPEVASLELSAGQGAPVVLTNGAWHGAWCWAQVVTSLAKRGVNAVPVELMGFGGLSGASPLARRARPFDPVAFVTERSGVADVTLDGVVDALIADLRDVGAGRPALVVAHSLGGVVATAAAERAPELFASLVYISAMTPVVGLSASVYNSLPEMADSLLSVGIAADPQVVGAIRCDFDSPDGEARATFYADVPDKLAAAACSLLCSDAPGQVDQPVATTRERFGSIPRHYVVCTEDRALTPALQRRMIAELDDVSAEPCSVTELRSSHSPFLSCPENLADLITRLRHAAGANAEYADD